MKKTFILFVIITWAGFLFAQSPDTISGKENERITINGNSFYKHGIKLTTNQIFRAVFKNEEARGLVSKAKTEASIATGFGYIGGFLIGYPLGQAMGGGEAQWGIAGVGAGVLLIAFPLASGANKKLKKAVKIYNKGLDESGEKSLTSIELTPTRYGVGLVFRF